MAQTFGIGYVGHGFELGDRHHPSTTTGEYKANMYAMLSAWKKAAKRTLGVIAAIFACRKLAALEDLWGV
jgi:hypothetical protein